MITRRYKDYWVCEFGVAHDHGERCDCGDTEKDRPREEAREAAVTKYRQPQYNTDKGALQLCKK